MVSNFSLSCSGLFFLNSGIPAPTLRIPESWNKLGNTAIPNTATVQRYSCMPSCVSLDRGTTLVSSSLNIQFTPFDMRTCRTCISSLIIRLLEFADSSMTTDCDLIVIQWYRDVIYVHDLFLNRQRNRLFDWC